MEEERRQLPRLTKEEVADIAAAILLAQGEPTPHVCRFPRIEERDIEEIVRIHHEIPDKELREAVEFYKNFNRMMSDTGRTFRNLVVTLGFSTVVGLLAVGLWAEIKKHVGN